MLDLFIEQPYVGTHPSEALEKEKGHLYKRINNDKVAPDGVKALSALGIALYLVRQLQREHEHRQKEIGKVNVCAGGILCRENKIVLGKRSADRSFYPRVWDIIGGHVVSNETPEQTLIRELKEELDVIATEWKLLTVLLDQEPGLNEQYSYYIYVESIS